MVKETSEGNMVLGSFFTWLVARLAALLLLAYSLYKLPTLDISIQSGVEILAVLYLLYRSNELAYGRSDERGIHYRRYLRSTYVPWHSIVSITENARVTMSIVVERRDLFTRRLMFLSGPNPARIGRLPEAFPKLRNIWLEGRRI
jgi:hypothetical protein